MSIVVLILLLILCIVLCMAFLDYMGFLRYDFTFLLIIGYQK